MTVDLSREELLVENGRLLAALQRLGEAYQIREESMASLVEVLKAVQAERDEWKRQCAELGAAHRECVP